MSDAKALVRILELEDVIGRLQNVRNAVGAFNIASYENAGGALWAGEKRNRFKEALESSKSSCSQIGDQIGQAIEDCKGKQRALAFSINAFEHPALSAQAFAIALT